MCAMCASNGHVGRFGWFVRHVMIYLVSTHFSHWSVCVRLCILSACREFNWIVFFILSLPVSLLGPCARIYFSMGHTSLIQTTKKQNVKENDTHRMRNNCHGHAVTVSLCALPVVWRCYISKMCMLCEMSEHTISLCHSIYVNCNVYTVHCTLVHRLKCNLYDSNLLNINGWYIMRSACSLFPSFAGSRVSHPRRARAHTSPLKTHDIATVSLQRYSPVDIAPGRVSFHSDPFANPTDKFEFSQLRCNYLT